LAVDRAELVGGQLDPTRSAQSEPDRIEKIVRITHDLRIEQRRASLGR
jgi:hypothetical protein